MFPPLHRAWVPQLCLLLLATLLSSIHAHTNSGGPITAFAPTDAVLAPLGATGAVSTAAALTNNGKQEAVTCPAGIEPDNPDFGKGQFSQGVSYGIPMMQVGCMALQQLHSFCCCCCGPGARDVIAQSACHRLSQLGA
jgi:hypothetical protein